MAYSRSSPRQVAAQIAAGVAALGGAYYVLYVKDKAPKPALRAKTAPGAAASAAATPTDAALIAALDRAAANSTSGKIWAAQREALEREQRSSSGGR
ncbi:hypothetical protein ABPG75_001301 [Micractinium tetrahymenae]